MQTFGIPEERMLVEPNGVAPEFFNEQVTKAEARARFGLPENEPFALYVGRFYAWKGLDILADAAAYSPLPIRLVGGTREEFESVTRTSGARLQFTGVRPTTEIPLWLAAADVLIVLGTARNEDSFRYTSPMKIFEYLAARRPTVAARTPALAAAIPREAVLWYEPDDSHSLARAIAEVHTSADAAARVHAGSAAAARHTWEERARRILAFINTTGSLTA